MNKEEIHAIVKECDVVISTLGHNLTFKGIFFPPRRLVTEAVKVCCEIIQEMKTDRKIKLVLMNTVGVSDPKGTDMDRKCMEGALLETLYWTLPPHADNVEALRYLSNSIGPENGNLEWCAVRPDSLIDEELSEYTLHQNLVTNLFETRLTSRINTAHFIVQLALDDKVWEEWKFKLPVILNKNQ